MQVYLLLGGNIGNVIEHFQKSIDALTTIGIIIKKSSVVQSKAWGFESSDLFYNQVILIETDLTPEEVLAFNQSIEKKLGRMRDHTGIYSSRTIDIDILYYENKVTKSELLEIPHPRLHLRNFTLVPLVEIAPDFVHPIFLISNAELLNNCEDQSVVNFL